jgi:hypothetical protein
MKAGLESLDMMTDITIIVTEDMGTMEVIEKILPPHVVSHTYPNDNIPHLLTRTHILKCLPNLF